MILITGASGYLGTHLLYEAKANANFVSVGREKPTLSKNHVFCDLSIIGPDLSKMYIDKVIHLAGKAHDFAKDTASDDYDRVNHQGTQKLLNALEQLEAPPKVIIYASTVAVYGRSSGFNITEGEETTPDTQYGKSKLDGENAIIKWCEINNVDFLILRLPLVVGENPPGNLGAMKKAIASNMYIKIKNNKAKKSIVLAKDITRLALNHEEGSGVYNITDGINPTFNEIEDAIYYRLRKKSRISLPISFLRILAFIGSAIENISPKPFPINNQRLQKLTSTLTFSDEKARRELGWSPSPALPYIKKYL